MPALTIKNIPDDLYSRLKQAAEIHRRSMNSEILYCVESTLVPRKVDVSEQISTARRLRAKTASHPLTDEILDAAKNAGRP